MSKEILQDFLDKSGVPISYISRCTRINRSQLSQYLHDHQDLSTKHTKILTNFLSEYKSRWRE